MNLEEIKKDEEIEILIETAEKQLTALGYTEHGKRHIGIVSELAGRILEELGYSSKEVELAKIAGYLHDIGNAINRVDHAHNGAILAYNILKRLGMSIEDAAEIMMAIGNHDEATGTAVSVISAALILADKSDVHRSRVRNENLSRFDIHDRVNYAVEEAKVEIDALERKLYLKLKIDIDICPVMKYFEIFLERMIMCKRAAAFLNIWFHIEINGAILL